MTITFWKEHIPQKWMYKLNWLLVIFEILPSSVGTDGGHIVAATKSKQILCQWWLKICSCCYTWIYSKNVILIAYKE